MFLILTFEKFKLKINENYAENFVNFLMKIKFGGEIKKN